MTYEEYQERVLARASHRWYNEKLDFKNLRYVLEQFIRYGNCLDRVKKSLMYGRDFYFSRPWDAPVMTPTPMLPERDQRLIHAMLGVATEGVEMMEAVHAFFFDGKPFDTVNLQEEFGDTEWYRAFGLATLGQTHEENLLQNDTKLEKRFGSTFTEAAANERDLDGERRCLEGKTMPDVNETLTQRGAEYGDWTEDGGLADELIGVVEESKGWTLMPPFMRQSIRMILVKVARLCVGNPRNKDSWHDIQGYAKLAEDRTEA